MGRSDRLFARPYLYVSSDPDAHRRRALHQPRGRDRPRSRDDPLKAFAKAQEDALLSVSSVSSVIGMHFGVVRCLPPLPAPLPAVGLAQPPAVALAGGGARFSCAGVASFDDVGLSVRVVE